MLDIVTATLTTPPNRPKFVISVYPNKSSTLIIDLIAAIRAMKKIPEAYRQPAWKWMGTLPKRYRRIDLVADTYQEVSIKNCECFGRGTSVHLMINSLDFEVPSDFTKFMKCGENKTRLINLICKVISSDYKRVLSLLKCNEINFSKKFSFCLTLAAPGFFGLVLPWGRHILPPPPFLIVVGLSFEPEIWHSGTLPCCK